MEKIKLPEMPQLMLDFAADHIHTIVGRSCQNCRMTVLAIIDRQLYLIKKEMEMKGVH